MKCHNQNDNLAEQLEATRKNIIRITTAKRHPLNKYLNEFVHSHGKLIRPTLYYLFRNLGDQPISKHDLDIATSIELLHMATLIHDDIIDEANIRRGVPSVQVEFGKDVAVYAGDYLFTLFFELLVDQVKDLDLIKLNVETMNRILSGELNQKALRYNFSQMNVISYLNSTYGKTAAIFGLACYEGAVFAEQPVKICRLALKIGFHIGVVFQIVDDLIDYLATSQEAHKPVHQDLAEGVYTLPLILAYRGHESEFDPLLQQKESITSDEIDQVIQLIRKYDGILKTQQIAMLYLTKTTHELTKIEDTHLTMMIEQLLDELKGKIINE